VTAEELTRLIRNQKINRKYDEKLGTIHA